ncbi:MAG: transposase [Desulforhopalus sp.]
MGSPTTLRRRKKKNKMGRSRYTITDNNAPHFLTFTVLNWLPIFTRPQTVQIILDALIWRQSHKNIKVYGYVILENHMHCILQAPDLRRQVHDFKAFTAKEILRYLEQNKAQKILEQLALFKKSHKTDSNYQLWEEGSHPQLIQNEDILRQKLDYIHLNPVKRGYVEDAVHWRYSSARNYQGQAGLIPVYTEW